MKNSIYLQTALLTFLFLLCALIFVTYPLSTHAQLPGIGESPAQIELEPRHPSPQSSFTARLGDYSSTFGGGTLSWYLNGVLDDSFANKSSVTLTAPLIGIPLKLEVRSTNGARTSTTIVPSELDVIIEGDTSAPYFYQGRRIPGLGTTARISVIPRLFDIKGRLIPSDKISYTWSIENKRVENGGRAVLETLLPGFGSPLVLLTASAPAYNTEIDTAFYITNTNPSLQFYVHNPLTGLSRNAMQESYLRAVDEVSVRAEPYGVAQNIYQNAQYGWSINGGRVENTGRDSQMITLRKQGSGGVSDIAFSLRSLSTLSQYAQGLFRLEF